MTPRALIGVTLVTALAAMSAWGEASVPTVRDLARIVRQSDPRLSPDGKTLAFVESRANLDEDLFQTEILLMPASGGDARPLTRGRRHAASPRWSPSGDRIAFLAPDADKVMQLYVMPMAGGDALQLTQGKDGVDQFAWSPDGASIAYAMADPKPDLKGEDKFRTASDGNGTQIAATGASPYVGDGMAVNRRQSPSNSVTKITAPMLIMCDTGDFRVPIAQSFGLYRALVDNHVKTEFYAIPVGGHFPNDPIRQMDVYQRWQEWLVPYLR